MDATKWAEQKIRKDKDGYYWDPDHPDRFETRSDAEHNQRYWVSQTTGRR